MERKHMIKIIAWRLSLWIFRRWDGGAKFAKSVESFVIIIIFLVGMLKIRIEVSTRFVATAVEVRTMINGEM